MIALPAYLDSEAWTGFVAMRQSMPKSKPFTTRAATLILYELQRLKDAGHDPNAALDQSTLHGWADVYEPKAKPISKSERNQAAQTTAYLARQDEISSSPEVRAAVVQALKLVRRA